MKIEEGKRYIRRDGTLSSVIYSNALGISGLEFPFRDKTETYNQSGQCWYTHQSELDLIAEYKEQEMKEIDFDKPLRFMDSTDELKYIGLASRALHVVEIVPVNGLIQVDKYGKSAGWSNVENIPEKLVMWVNFYKDSAYGYLTREEADHAAGSYRLSCVRVECDEGEGL